MLVYNEQETERLASRIKNDVISIIIVFALTFAAIVLLCFIATSENVRLFTVMASVLLMLSGWYAIGKYYLTISPCRSRLRHLRRIFSGISSTVSGTVTIGNVITVLEGIRVREIIVDGLRTLYFEGENFPFVNGDTVSFVIVHNFITAFEEQNV